MPPSATQQFSGIFVSYRRDDSSGHAGRLFDRLVQHFGRTRIFMDIDTIEPGEDFVTVIENAVGSCDILIAIIGQNWISSSGAGRLDNPSDFVRIEIATALRRDIRVIPVLVQRASMPKPQDLPEELLKLTRRNAVELSDVRWQSDVDQLISVMERVLAKRAEAEQLAEVNHFDEKQRHQEVEEKRRVREQLLVAEEAKLHDDRQNVEAEHEGGIEEVERRKRKAEKRLDAPATIVTAGAASPANKHSHLMLIAGASLIVLIAAAFLIWQSQRDHNSSHNTNPAATAQPSVVAQPSAAKPTQTPFATAPDGGSVANATGSSGEESFSLGEATLWKRNDTGDLLQIVRNGDTVRAIMEIPSASAAARGRRKGDLAFKGSYKGREIRGTAYLLFSDADVRRCPEFGGDQRFAFDLTLSADGSTLNGSREDFELSVDCNIINLPRKRLTYTRASR